MIHNTFQKYLQTHVSYAQPKRGVNVKNTSTNTIDRSVEENNSVKKL